MPEVSEADVDRMCDLMKAPEQPILTLVKVARNLLAAGVTLPPEPPKWGYCGNGLGYGQEWNVTLEAKAHDHESYDDRNYRTVELARRLAEHLNETGFSPDIED